MLTFPFPLGKDKELDRTGSRRRTATRLIPLTAALGVILAGLVVFGSAGPASASVSKHHGKWAGQVSGCSNNFRIGTVARLVAANGVDYGWVEWRASRTGQCAGYQWVRMHFTKNLGYTARESNYKSWAIYYKNSPWFSTVNTSTKYNLKVGGARYLKAGAYNSRITYAPSVKACAELITYANSSGLSLKIKGQGSPSKWTYCA